MITLAPRRPSGTVEIPASKSQTIRAFLIACFSREESVIRHPLISADTQSAIRAVETLGAKVRYSDDKAIAYVDARSVDPSGAVTVSTVSPSLW